MAASRTIAWSRQLAQVHDTLRHHLQDLQADLDSAAPLDDALLTHCVAFCQALTTHHQGEDSGLFADLLVIRPDLRPAITNLIQDHHVISGILVSVRHLTEAARTAGPERRDAIRRELDGLAAVMESHFRYEERAIGAALDADPGERAWNRAVFTPYGQGDGRDGR